MAQLVKTMAGLAIASVKTVNGLAIASAKTIAGLDNTSGGGDTTFITGQSLGIVTQTVDEKGMKITVGGSSITVTELGMWGLAGQYSTTITVYIRATDGTSLGSVEVPTPSGSGAAGQYNWATLSSPVVLSASTSYFIMTRALNFNDIYGGTTTVTPTAAATVDDTAFGQPPAVDGVGSNRCYGPLNFKYHL